MTSVRYRWVMKLSGTLGVLFIAGLAVCYLTTSSVTYQGKTLEQWIQLMDTKDPAVQSQATHAIRAIGTNALPVLTQWMEHRDTEAERQFHRWLTSNRRFEALWPTLLKKSENHREYMALLGFYALGSDARSALPALERLILEGDSTNPTKAANAAQAYVYVDPPGAERLAAQWGATTNRSAVAAADQLMTTLISVRAKKNNSVKISPLDP